MRKNESFLQYPNMRQELLDYLHDLVDRSHQERHWVAGEAPKGGAIECFDSVIHFLFDDLNLENRPKSAIGSLLYDEEELAAVSQVITAINAVLDDIGLEGRDEEYVRSRHWPRVVSRAAAALSILETRRVIPDGSASP